MCVFVIVSISFTVEFTSVSIKSSVFLGVKSCSPRRGEKTASGGGGCALD